MEKPPGTSLHFADANQCKPSAPIIMSNLVGPFGEACNRGSQPGD
jgi:hypothetical protein